MISANECWHRRDAPQIPLSDWSPHAGMNVLLRRLSISQEVCPPHSSSEARLHSLLESAREASSICRVTVVNVIPGFIVGITLGCLLGHAVGVGLPNVNEFVALAIGGSIGAFTGAITHAILLRERLALRRLVAACNRYSIDVNALEALSAGHGRLVARAARAIRDAAEE